MATWRAENSMLTARGIEITSKIKAGIGSITITKIVAGSGRVSESLLSNQTQVSGITKPMVLSHTESREGGSEITLYIQNEGFTEDFILNQIGVYVSHPDYEGEQLYHISQCDADGYDTIPAFEDTVTTFGYSLFLENGNSSSINITVDPQGMVPRPEFDKYTAMFHHMGFDVLTPTNTGYETLFDLIKSLYISGKASVVAKVNGFLDMPRVEWGFTLVARNGEADLWDVQLTESLTGRIFVRQLNTNSTWIHNDWMKVVLSPLIEEMEFNRNDTLGSAKIYKNSSADADYGFTLRDYSDNGREAWFNLVASELVASISFKFSSDSPVREYELLHTGNIPNVAVPSGLVRNFFTVGSNYSLHHALNDCISATKENGQETFILSVTENIDIPSDLYFITVRKHTDKYLTVTGYGVLTETDSTIHRRKVNGVWSPWRVTYGTNVVPATVE